MGLHCDRVCRFTNNSSAFRSSRWNSIFGLISWESPGKDLFLRYTQVVKRFCCAPMSLNKGASEGPLKIQIRSLEHGQAKSQYLRTPSTVISLLDQ